MRIVEVSIYKCTPSKCMIIFIIGSAWMWIPMSRVYIKCMCVCIHVREICMYVGMLIDNIIYNFALGCYVPCTMKYYDLYFSKYL